MSLIRGYAGPRVLVGVVITVVVLAYFWTQPNSPELVMAGEADASPLPGLKISLEQKSGASPSAITVSVSNTNSKPVTILSYDSPLDPLALQLGFLSITPSGASEPLDIPKVQVRRIWPPKLEQLITIPPGKSQTNDIVLKPIVVNPDDLGNKPSVQLKGQYQAVWAKEKTEVDTNTLDNPQSAPDAFHGDFISDVLELNIS